MQETQAVDRAASLSRLKGPIQMPLASLTRWDVSARTGLAISGSTPARSTHRDGDPGLLAHDRHLSSANAGPFFASRFVSLTLQGAAGMFQ